MKTMLCDGHFSANSLPVGENPSSFVYVILLEYTHGTRDNIGSAWGNKKPQAGTYQIELSMWLCVTRTVCHRYK